MTGKSIKSIKLLNITRIHQDSLKINNDELLVYNL